MSASRPTASAHAAGSRPRDRPWRARVLGTLAGLIITGTACC